MANAATVEPVDRQSWSVVESEESGKYNNWSDVKAIGSNARDLEHQLRNFWEDNISVSLCELHPVDKAAWHVSVNINDAIIRWNHNSTVYERKGGNRQQQEDI